MSRHSTADREVVDGPWPRGLNDASGAVDLEGGVPEMLDCDVTPAGGIVKRRGLVGLAFPMTGGSLQPRSAVVLLDFLHDGRMVVGTLVPTNFNIPFFPWDSSTGRIHSEFVLQALPPRVFPEDESAFDNAVEAPGMEVGGSIQRLNYPRVVRIGGRTYVSAFGNVAKWDGRAWHVRSHDDTVADDPDCVKPWDPGMFGYFTRKESGGVPTAVSDIMADGFAKEEPARPTQAERAGDRSGGGGLPRSDLIGLYQVGDRQVMLSAHGDKVRYSFPTPYGAGNETGDGVVHGPQDWLEEAWLDVGESGSFDYVTCFQQIQETLFIFKRSSIWMVYGDLSPGGLGVRKLHEGVGARHAGLVAPAGGSGGVAFFDMVTASLWLMDASGRLEDLWGQRIRVDLNGTDEAAGFLFNSFVASYHNKVYTALPFDGEPKFRTYVTDLATGSVALYSYGSSYMRVVEFFGHYGLMTATRITGEGGPGTSWGGGVPPIDSQPGEKGNWPSSLAWIEHVSRAALTPAEGADRLGRFKGRNVVRNVYANVTFKAMTPSVDAGEQADWSALRPKWRGGHITVSNTGLAGWVFSRGLVDPEQPVHVAADIGPTQLRLEQDPSSDSSVSVRLRFYGMGITIHRVAMRYWRRR